MPSLFGRKRPPAKPQDDSGGLSHSFSSFSLVSGSKNRQPDYKRSASTPSGSSLQALNSPKPGTSLDRKLSDTSGSHDEPEGPLDLKYGYFTEPLQTLEIGVVEEIVRLCSHEIKTRGLHLPLLLSTKALDITRSGVVNLIQAHTYDRMAWKDSLVFASPHDLAAMVKWSLGRIVNAQGRHGFLAYEIYERWRLAERQSGYQVGFIKTHLLSRLPSTTANLIQSLFDLLSSTAAYSSANGSSPKKLSAIFSSYIFGLPADEPFERTYAAFARFSNATEHLLLAFIRCNTDQLGSVPTKLKMFVQDYPKNLPPPNSAIRPDAQLREVRRASRLTRFYTQDLIQAAGTWEVPRSKAWNALYPMQRDANKANLPVFAGTYKHLLNIHTDEPETDEHQRYRSTVEKDWADFATAGFSPEPQDKLKFDLNETARQRHRGPQRVTRNWNDFSESGFLGQDVLDKDLSFNPDLQDTIAGLPNDKARFEKLVRKTEKGLPEFPYDVTPHEGRPILMDEYFFETWADVLVSSGWLRDEIKDCNWVLVQYRSRPAAGVVDPSDPDGRTDEQWFLIEESVPEDYRHDVESGKTKKSKRLSFLRPSRKKTTKVPNGSTTSLSSNAQAPTFPVQPIDESVFAPGLGGTTRYLSFDRPPSQTGSENRGLARPTDLHLNEALVPPPPAPKSPYSPVHGALPGTMTSQSQSPMPPADEQGTLQQQQQQQRQTGPIRNHTRRTSSMEQMGRGPGFLDRMRTMRQRQPSMSSMSEYEARTMENTNSDVGANGSNGSWVGLVRRATKTSRASMDSLRGVRPPSRQRTASSGGAPAIHLNVPSEVSSGNGRDLPAAPHQSPATSTKPSGNSGVPSLNGVSAHSNEAVEELDSASRSHRAPSTTTADEELWRGSRYDAMSPEPVLEAPNEDEENFYRGERPRAPSPPVTENEEALSSRGAPTVQSADYTADHTTNVPPAPNKSPQKETPSLPAQSEPASSRSESPAPPLPSKAAAEGNSSTAAGSGPHSERVARLVAMYSSRDGGVKKKPVPELPKE